MEVEKVDSIEKRAVLVDTESIDELTPAPLDVDAELRAVDVVEQRASMAKGAREDVPEVRPR